MPRTGVCSGASIHCSFGTTPSQLLVAPIPGPAAGVLGQSTQANILDYQPGFNIPGFALCLSMANPAVSASMGSPAPCTPMTNAPWTPGDPQSLVHGAPALTQDSVCMCVFGGVITID